MKKMNLMCVMVVAVFAANANAITLTDVDFNSTPTVTLPTGWSVTDPELLFDGNSANGIRTIFTQNAGAALTGTNFISINVELDSFDVTDIRMAHDQGGAASQEVTDMDVIFSGTSGVLASFSASNLDDGVILDIDDVVVGIDVEQVTSIEFRITGVENSQVEVREILIDGEFHTVPEPATATLGLLGLAGLARRRRRIA